MWSLQKIAMNFFLQTEHTCGQEGNIIIIMPSTAEENIMH